MASGRTVKTRGEYMAQGTFSTVPRSPLVPV